MKHSHCRKYAISLMIVLFQLILVPTIIDGEKDREVHAAGNIEKVTTPFGNGDDYGADIVILEDGKILVAGRAHNGTDFDFAMARYNPDLTLDTTFGDGGKVLTPVGIEHDYINAIALQADGKIVAAGRVHQPTRPWSRFGLARYHPDGSLDASFGDGGKVITSLSNWFDEAISVLIQPDDKIVVSGTADFGVPSDFAIARYNPDGTLDTSFGNGGKVTKSFTGNYDLAFGDVLLQGDKLILTGIIELAYGHSQFAIARFNENGSLDTTFGSGGRTIIDFEEAIIDVAYGAVMQPDGKIVMTGWIDYETPSLGHRDVALARFDGAGNLDPTFGNGGKVITDVSGSGGNDYELSFGITLDPDTGQILVAGSSSDDFVVLRYNPNGSLDTSFGNNGFYAVDFAGESDIATDVVVADDGAIFAAGYAHNGQNNDFALVKIATDDEGPVTANVVANPNPVEIGTNITLSANVDDTTTGGSNIASAEYKIDVGSFNPMDAADGTFDEVSEDVVANIEPFTDPDVHKICVRGTDVAENTGAEECLFLAVYDPDGGFVTGGGWIDSLPGAYVADPLLTGKATFGFVSKYKKGATVPTGQTEFLFQVADLNFHSDSYDWLVVAGHKAMYKGTGTINGTGNYGFMLSAIDEKLTPSTAVDLFRIKIWDKDDADAIIYDNQMNAADDDDPTTAIGGGNIVIHTK